MKPVPASAQQLAPSSIGLSFIVEADCDAVTVRASWGEYERREVPDGSEIDPEEAGDIDPDADPEATATTKHKEYRWVRNPLEVRRQPSLSKRNGREQISPGASIEWLVDSLGEHRVVSVFLVNTRTAPQGRRANEAWMYQPELSISGDSHDLYVEEIAPQHAPTPIQGHGVRRPDLPSTTRILP